jgi:hypothetical protein
VHKRRGTRDWCESYLYVVLICCAYMSAMSSLCHVCVYVGVKALKGGGRNRVHPLNARDAIAAVAGDKGLVGGSSVLGDGDAGQGRGEAGGEGGGMARNGSEWALVCEFDLLVQRRWCEGSSGSGVTTGGSGATGGGMQRIGFGEAIGCGNEMEPELVKDREALAKCVRGVYMLRQHVVVCGLPQVSVGGLGFRVWGTGTAKDSVGRESGISLDPGLGFYP